MDGYKDGSMNKRSNKRGTKKKTRGQRLKESSRTWSSSNDIGKETNELKVISGLWIGNMETDQEEEERRKSTSFGYQINYNYWLFET